MGAGETGDQEAVAANNTPFAYVYRDGEPVFRDASQPQQYFPGSKLIVHNALNSDAAPVEILNTLFPDGNYDAKDLTVSNDGKYLLFSARGDKGQSWNIYEYAFEQQELQRIIRDDDRANAGNDTAPVYSNSRIIFSSDRSTTDDGTHLYIMERDGSDLTQITEGQQQDVDVTALGSGNVVFTRQNTSEPSMSAALVSGLTDPFERAKQPQLMKLNADGQSLQPLTNQISLPTQQLSGLVQGHAGRLMALSGTQNSPLAGGQIIEFSGNKNNQSASADQSPAAEVQAQYEELRGRSLTSDNAEPSSNTTSTLGWYSAFWPYRDGSSRMLVSWSQCYKNEGRTVRLCENGENLENVDPRYGIWVFDANENSRRPVLRAKVGRIYSEVVLGYPNENNGLPFDALPPGEPIQPPVTPDPDKPDTDKPGSGDPDTDKPGSGDPDTDKPGSGDPDTDKPGGGDPDTGNPDTGDPDTPDTNASGQAISGDFTINEDDTLVFGFDTTKITGFSQLTKLVITDVPAGVTLAPATDLGAGRWQVSAAQLASLKLTPITHSADDLVLKTEATFVNTNGPGDADDKSRSYNGSLNIVIYAVADVPSLSVKRLDGSEGDDGNDGDNSKNKKTVRVEVSHRLNDTDGSETFTSMKVSGLPPMAIVQDASLLVADNSWQLDDVLSNSITIDLAADHTESFTLTLVAANQDIDNDDQLGGDESVRPLSRNQIQATLNITIDVDEPVDEGVGIIHLRSIYAKGLNDQSEQGITTLANPTLSPMVDRSARFVRVLVERSVGSEQFDIAGYAPVQPDGSVLFASSSTARMTLEVVNRYGKALNEMAGSDYRYQNFARSKQYFTVIEGEVQHYIGFSDNGDLVPMLDNVGANAGAATNQWPGVTSDLTARVGETMAQTLARHQPDNKRLRGDLIYNNPWTANTADAIAVTMSSLTTEKPTTVSCETNWQDDCVIDARYDNHIEPVLDKINRVFIELSLLGAGSSDGTTITYDRLFTNWTPFMYLLNRYSTVNPASCRRILPPPSIEPENDCFTCYAQSLMNKNGAVLSANFFDLFDNDEDDDHSFFRPVDLTEEQRERYKNALSPAELRLIAEWLDQGAPR